MIHVIKSVKTRRVYRETLESVFLTTRKVQHFPYALFCNLYDLFFRFSLVSSTKPLLFFVSFHHRCLSIDWKEIKVHKRCFALMQPVMQRNQNTSAPYSTPFFFLFIQKTILQSLHYSKTVLIIFSLLFSIFRNFLRFRNRMQYSAIRHTYYRFATVLTAMDCVLVYSVGCTLIHRNSDQFYLACPCR